jgi:hypothetical protein
MWIRPLSALKVRVRFDPALPVEFRGVQGFDPYAAEVVAEEKPAPGQILVSIALQPEKKPASGALAQVLFAKKGEKEVTVPVRLEVVEARRAGGRSTSVFP